MNLWLQTSRKIYSSLDKSRNNFALNFSTNQQLSQISQKRHLVKRASLAEDESEEKANKKLYLVDRSNRKQKKVESGKKKVKRQFSKKEKKTQKVSEIKGIKFRSIEDQKTSQALKSKHEVSIFKRASANESLNENQSSFLPILCEQLQQQSQRANGKGSENEEVKVKVHRILKVKDKKQKMLESIYGVQMRSFQKNKTATQLKKLTRTHRIKTDYSERFSLIQ